MLIFLHKSYAILQFCILSTINSKKIGYYLKDLLISLGPIYIKIGQHLAYYHEKLIPLLDLQENISVNDTFYIDNNIASKLQELSTKHKIKLIQETPIANASISVVFLAEYKNKKVVLKMRKDEILKNLNSDLSFIRIITKIISFLLRLQYIKTISEKCINNFFVQLDFKNEYLNWLQYYTNYKDDETVIIPRMYKECCTYNIIVMDYAPGTCLYNIYDKKDKEQCADMIYNHFINNIENNNNMHSDLHCGNIRFIETSKKIVLYDFGFVNNISNKDKKLIIKLLSQCNVNNITSTNVLLELFFDNLPQEQEKLDSLSNDFFDILYRSCTVDNYHSNCTVDNYHSNISQLSITKIILEFQQLITKYKMTNNIRHFNFHQSFFALFGTLNTLGKASIIIERQQKMLLHATEILKLCIQQNKKKSIIYNNIL